MNSNKKLLFKSLLVAVLLVISGCSFFQSSGPNLTFTTQKGKVVYKIEIADTYEQRKNGLMFRTSLPAKNGMLFVFDQQKNLTFWMKNTLIPLDMIFMDAGYKVVHIEKNLPPCKTEPCPLYFSGTPALYTLEVNGGEADKLGINEGDQAEVTK